MLHVPHMFILSIISSFQVNLRGISKKKLNKKYDMLTVMAGFIKKKVSRLLKKDVKNIFDQSNLKSGPLSNILGTWI